MKLPSFSYSKWNSHSECALRMKLSMIDKLCGSCKMGPLPRDAEECQFCHTKAIKAEPLIRGIKFAKDIEAYLKGTSDKIPEIANSAAYAAAVKLRAARAENPLMVLVEEYMGFATGTHENGGFFMTAGVDVMILDPEEKHIQILDWKTGSVGKRKGLKSGSEGKYVHQLEFYGTMALDRYPWVEQVSTGLYFTDAIDVGRVGDKAYYRSEARGLMSKWKGRAQTVLGDTTFAPTSNYWCNWCDFRKDEGGPCPLDLQPKKVKEI